MDILSKISSPEDLKTLSVSDLEILAKEVRAFILSEVSRTGGHLASSLGVVEMTIALHYVFNTPFDKILWDVGHQSYAHKILTGRRDQFSTLRQLGGLHPFINPKESPYDAFVSGHAGNAISAASGLCEAIKKSGSENKVLAVVGDGSLSTGLALEALNFVGEKKQDLIVVLNDNKVSISKTVGAIADYLSRVMTSKAVRDIKEGIKPTLRDLPVVGGRLFRVAKFIEGNLKGIVAPAMLFEKLGFRCVGPIDGHSIPHLVEAFENISRMKGPLLIHVLTQKGYGYTPALEDPEHFHGIGKFDLENGEVATTDNHPTYSDVFGETLIYLAKRDPRIVAITAAMTSGTGLKPFAKEFPDRFFDVGIAEGHAVTMAAGMAVSGLRPVVAIYSTFLQRSYDEIIHDVALQNAPVIFAIDRAGIVGPDGATHHGMFDIAFLRSIPNITLMIPRDHIMLGKMLERALKMHGPVAIRYPREAVVEKPLKYKGLKKKKTCRSYFLTGALILVPLFITIYIILVIIHWVAQSAGLGRGLVADIIGLFVAILAILLVGAFTQNIIGGKTISWLNVMLAKIPIAGAIHSAIRQIMEGFMLRKSAAFRKVVIIEYPRKGIYCFAFVTKEGHINKHLSEEGPMIHVFLPTTPNPTSGFFLIVPEKDVIPLDISVQEAFKVIISGGIASYQSNK